MRLIRCLLPLITLPLATVGTAQQGSILCPTNISAGANFGGPVKIDGDTMAVSAFSDSTSAGAKAGSVLLYTRDAAEQSGWRFTNKLEAPDGQPLDQFGFGLSLNGDVLVVGTRDDDDRGPGSGSAYLFVRGAAGVDDWNYAKKFYGSSVSTLDRFGSWMGADGDTLVISAALDDLPTGESAGSVYIFQRDAGGVGNWGQVKFLTVPDGNAFAAFGVSVAVEGTRLAVGAYGANLPGAAAAGAVYLFEQDSGGANNWGMTKKITAADAAADDRFGWVVALEGETLAVSSRLDDTAAGADAGSVYLFKQDEGGAENWGQVAQLTADDGAAGDQFGMDVKLQGDSLVVSAIYHDLPGVADAGAVYLFGRNQGGPEQWGQSGKTAAPDAAESDYFGQFLELSGSDLAASAIPKDTAAGVDAGCVYLNPSPLAAEPAVICPTNVSAGANFGGPVKIDGDTMAVSAFSDSTSAGAKAGSVLLYTRDAAEQSGWRFTNKLEAPDGQPLDQFGFGLSLNGDVLVVGTRDDDDRGPGSGSAYLFVRGAAGVDDWNYAKKFYGSSVSTLDRFGSWMGADGDTLVISAALDDLPTGESAGSVYIFQRDAGGVGNWGQVKFLTVPDGNAFAAFGVSVAVEGTRLAVGAYGANLPGAAAAGAVYLFEQDSGGANNWGMTKKITAADAAADDRFGWVVALEGETLAVSSRLDDTAAGADAGSVYLFKQDEGGAENWGQVAQLTADDGAAGDQFGMDVKLQGDSLLVSAIYHDLPGVADAGAVYLFGRNQGGPEQWGQSGKTAAPDAAESDYFGQFLELSGSDLAASAIPKDTAAGVDAGCVYLNPSPMPPSPPSTNEIIAASGLSGDGSEFTILIRTVAGYVFSVQRSRDLVNWTTIRENITGDGNLVEVIDDAIDQNPEFYYRVRFE